MQSQYSCIEHMMRYYGWLFNADGEEEKKEEVSTICVCVLATPYTPLASVMLITVCTCT